jgi:hypothetical protein
MNSHGKYVDAYSIDVPPAEGGGNIDAICIQSVYYQYKSSCFFSRILKMNRQGFCQHYFGELANGGKQHQLF